MQIKKAVILAAGRGTRMGRATDEIPKPMLPVRGRPMLQHIVERLQRAGIQRFLFVVGYRHEVIEQHFRNLGPDIGFVLQDPVNGTGSAALLARGFVAGEPFLLTFGDILCEADEYDRCGSILDSSPAAVAVIGVKKVDDPWQGAAVYEEEGLVRKIIEKPVKGTSTTHWNSAGVYAFRPVLFQLLQGLKPSPRNEYELTSAIEQMIESDLEVRISPIEGRWRDVGRPEDLAAENEAPPASE